MSDQPRLGRRLSNLDASFLCADELQGFAAQGVTRLCTAFSRLPGQRKSYVQDRLIEEREEVWRLIAEGGVVYVCGDASRMAPDVRRALIAIHGDRTGAGAAASERWLDDLTAQHRYLVDVWAAT